MDGENNGKPYEQMDDLGGKPIIFGKPPYRHNPQIWVQPPFWKPPNFWKPPKFLKKHMSILFESNPTRRRDLVVCIADARAGVPTHFDLRSR